MTNRRWTCPKGEHPGVLAPGRLRKNDIRRFCWPCSVKAGVLVERVCAANAAQGERAKARAERKAKAKRRAAARTRAATAERQRAREVIDGLDVARELERLWAHGLRLRGDVMPRRIPIVTVSRSDAHAGGVSGHATHDGRKIHITAGTATTRVRVASVLAHEVAHMMAPGESHSEVFWAVFQELVAAAYGVQPRALEGSKYAKHMAIESGMRDCAWLRDGGKPPRRPSMPRGIGVARVKSVMAR